jgi:hypothetical protein
MQVAVHILGERYVHSIKKDLQDTQQAAVEHLLHDAVSLPLLALTMVQEDGAHAPLDVAELQRLMEQAQHLLQHWRS